MNRNGYQNSDFGVVHWVHQEDPMGCYVAAMATITGKTYAQVKAETGKCWENGGHQWAEDQYLSDNGFSISRLWSYNQFKGHSENGAWLNDRREPWPPQPFAPIHLCMVQTSAGHAVVMLADGTILDPLTPEPKQLSDYSAVHHVGGIWRTEQLDQESREVRRMLVERDYDGLAAYLNRNNRERAKAAVERLKPHATNPDGEQGDGAKTTPKSE